MNNAYAYCFKEGLIATTGGLDIEHIKFLGQVSTIMRALTSKHGDLLSHFDQINAGDTNASINNTSLKELFIDNDTVAVNRGKTKGQLPLQHVFGFCQTFKTLTKSLWFHLTLKTASVQDIIFTTLGNDIIVTIDSLYLFVLIIIPNTDAQE